MANLFLVLFVPFIQPPNLEEIQKNVLESKLALHSGEIEIAEKKKSRSDPQKALEETSITWKITQSGVKVRGEFLTHKGFRAGIRKVAVVHGDIEGWAFMHEALPGAVACFGPANHGPTMAGKKSAMWFAADIRCFGTMPYEMVHSVTEETGWLLTQCNLKRFPYTIKEERLDNEKCYRFSGSAQPATPINSLEFTVLPHQGWTFSSIRVWGKDFENRLEIQNQKIDGIWFPKTMKFQQQSNGTLMIEEEVTIQVKSLNKAIPAETFLMKSLKLKDPTVVSLPDGHLKVWTRERLIEYDEYQLTTKPPKAIR